MALTWDPIAMPAITHTSHHVTWCLNEVQGTEALARLRSDLGLFYINLINSFTVILLARVTVKYKIPQANGWTLKKLGAGTRLGLGLAESIRQHRVLFELLLVHMSRYVEIKSFEEGEKPLGTLWIFLKMNFILELYPNQVMFGVVYSPTWAIKIA